MLIAITPIVSQMKERCPLAPEIQIREIGAQLPAQIPDGRRPNSIGLPQYRHRALLIERHLDQMTANVAIGAGHEQMFHPVGATHNGDPTLVNSFE